MAIRAASPVLQSIAHEIDSNEGKQAPRNKLGKNFVENLRRHKSHGDLDPNAAQHRA